jgi:anti-sigma B factor antagonist
MKLTHEDYEHVTVVTLKGDLTADHVDKLRKLAVERMEQQTRDFVLDVAEMEFVDSKGLETLLWLQERCGERLGQVRLAGTSANVDKILSLTRLSPRFDRHPDVSAAVKSLRV